MEIKTIVARLTTVLQGIAVEPFNSDEVSLGLERPDEIDAFLAEGPVMVSVFNYQRFQFEYISPNVETLLGIEPGLLKSLNYQKFLECYMHPGDMEVVALKLFPELVQFIATSPEEDLLKLTVHYNYRMKTATGSWIKIEQQTTPLKLDQAGKILLEQSFYIQTGEAAFDEFHPIKLQVSRRNEGLYKPCLLRTYLQKNAKANSLTPREVEVLRRLADGKVSSQIADELHISEATIVTHRRNMLCKLKLKNTSELVAWAFHSGIL